ncbi:hypothetical protein H9Q72_013327 [Fusarium xylarioides]|uniref:Uncharacterized protein n=1 Tax=Fusarium xylarioides TaxID=221167 RepID=A0A9P7KZM9_9HYPO|nr:hypothetical protein H9Q72_013327 [Fusarium xylarioides]
MSTQLRSLIDETLEDYINLEDVDDDVFSRFAQFAYSGSYASFEPFEKALVKPDSLQSGNALGFPSIKEDAGLSALFGQSGTPIVFGQPTELGRPTNTERKCGLLYSLASCITAKNPEGGDESCYHRGEGNPGVVVPSKRKRQAEVCKCDLPRTRKQEFISGFMRTHTPEFDSWQNPGKSKSIPQSVSFRHVLIGHARIWAFARKYAITSLMDLAYENLLQNLVHWVMSTQTSVPIYGELIRFVYGSCMDGDKLRLLMAHFAACVVEDVSHLEGWPELLNDVPAFTIGLVHKLTSRCAW